MQRSYEQSLNAAYMSMHASVIELCMTSVNGLVIDADV